MVNMVLLLFLLVLPERLEDAGLVLLLEMQQIQLDTQLVKLLQQLLHLILLLLLYKFVPMDISLLLKLYVYLVKILL